MTAVHRDHTVCGICDVSFFVCHRFRDRDRKVQNTNPGNKYCGMAYDAANIGHDEIKNCNQVQVLVKKPADQVKPTTDGYPLSKARQEDEEHFLTDCFPVGRRHWGFYCLVRLPAGSDYGIRKIKMCSHKEGTCVDEFDPEDPTHVVGAPFHMNCLEIFRNVSLYKNDRIVWAGLYQLGIQKNHAGFNKIERCAATETNHRYDDTTRENMWLHLPGTEWVVADPFVAQYAIQSACYDPPATGQDARDQVFSGTYRVAVGSIGAGSWSYWGPRVATWRHDLNLQARPRSIAAKRAVDAVVKKRKIEPSTLPRSSNNHTVLTGHSNAPPSNTNPAPALASAPPSSTPPKRDFFSTVPPETLLHIIQYLPALDLANLRLMSHKYAEIPMNHFRYRIAHDMPWAFEVFQDGNNINGELIPSPLPGKKIDYKEMYRLVRRTAGTGFGAIQGMRNRKRIWEACVRILEVIREEEEK